MVVVGFPKKNPYKIMIVKLITSVSNTLHCTFEKKKTNTCSSARLYENAYMHLLRVISTQTG